MGSTNKALVFVVAVFALIAAASAAGAGGPVMPVRVKQSLEADGMVGYGSSQVLLFENYFPSNPAGITRLDLDGSVDCSFGDGGTVHTYAEDIAVDRDGRILVATSNGGGESANRSDARVTRLLPDGRRDRSFGIGGSTDIHFGRRYDNGQAVAVAPDGDILLAGTELIYGSRYGNEVILMVARLKADGEPDPSFGKHGIAELPSGGEEAVFSVAATPSGGVVVDGGADSEADIWKLTKNGSLDRHFGDRGIVEMPFESKVRDRAETRLYAPGLVVAPSGKLLLAANGSSRGGGERIVAARLRPDGRLDRSYGHSGWATVTGVRGWTEAEGVALLPDGGLAIATTFSHGGKEHSEFGTVAFDSNGDLDRRFESDGVCRARKPGVLRAAGATRVGDRVVALGHQGIGEEWLLGCPLVDGS
jgi:uncharacterized delta-60 repeat protein